MKQEYLVCSCCGTGVKNNKEENVCFGEEPYPFDEGVGMCKSCGGDKVSKDVRKKLGWASCAFYDARISMLETRMNQQNTEKFKKMSYLQKISIIQKLIENGSII